MTKWHYREINKSRAPELGQAGLDQPLTRADSGVVTTAEKSEGVAMSFQQLCQAEAERINDRRLTVVRYYSDLRDRNASAWMGASMRHSGVWAENSATAVTGLYGKLDVHA